MTASGPYAELCITAIMHSAQLWIARGSELACDRADGPQTRSRALHNYKVFKYSSSEFGAR